MRIVGTIRNRVSTSTRPQKEKEERTHHQPLDILDARLLKTPPQKEDAERRPSEQEESERSRNQPIKRRQLVRSSKHDVQRRSVDDEHAQARSCDDAVEVVLVAEDLFAEGDLELGFDGEDVEALDDEDREIDCTQGLISTSETDVRACELTNGLGLGESIDLLLSGDDLSTTVDKVGTRLGEVG